MCVYVGVKDSEVRENRILVRSETTTGIDGGHHYEWSQLNNNNGVVPPYGRSDVGMDLMK